MVNDTLLNFGEIYDYNLRVIFDQKLELHLRLDVLSNQKNLKRYLVNRKNKQIESPPNNSIRMRYKNLFWSP